MSSAVKTLKGEVKAWKCLQNFSSVTRDANGGTTQ